MLRARIHQSTPFRLALAFGVLFILAFLTAGAITYSLLKRELTQALDASVRETYSVVSSTYVPNDLEDLIAAVNTYSGLGRSNNRIFLLMDLAGKKLAGNIPAAHLPEGLSNISANDVGLHGDDMFRTLSGEVGGITLVVGESYSATEDLEQIALAAFGWASFGIIALAVGGGAILAGRAQRRLDGIETTMRQVASGNLGHRIPLRGNGDDIDVVAGNINQALDRLASLVESIRQVSTDIAHDLKTPLNRLRLTLDQAIQQSEAGLSAIDLLLDAQREADQIKATFEALLRISQIEAGARKSRFREVDLSTVMSSVAEIYHDVAIDNGQTVYFEPAEIPSSLVHGDPELLTQLFVNLVENAITHCPPGTRVTMGLVGNGSDLIAQIADNGPGIPPSEFAQVFQRLYRLDKSRTTPGNGLGLSLVKAIAELHNAKVKLVDNQPGLRIHIRFPADRPE